MVIKDNSLLVATILTLVSLLVLELSGIQELVIFAKIVKTIGIIVVLMSERFQEADNNRFGIYCCFALVWTLLISTLGFVVYLITEREKDSLSLERVNKTE